MLPVQSSNFGFSADSSDPSGFGPDFLMNAMSSQISPSGAVYDANGNLVDTSQSPDAKATADALKQVADQLKSGDTAGARDTANQVLKKDPTNAVAAAYIGRSYLQDGDYQSAIKFFTRAASGSDDPQIQSDLHAAQTLAKGTDATVDEIGRLLKSPSTARDGASLASYFLDKNPDNLDARTLLVNYYDAGGFTNLAGAELTDAIDKVAPADLNRFVSIVEKFNQANPQDASSYDLLAQTYVRAGRLEDAQTAFSKALDLSGDNLDFQVQIKQDFSNTYLNLGRQQVAAGKEDDAEASFKAGLAVYSTDEIKGELSKVEQGKGEREMHQGQLKLALASLDEARTYMPGAPDKVRQNQLITDYTNLASKFQTSGDLKSVVSARYGAFMMDPADDTRKRSLADAYDTYGQDLASKGDYWGAIRQYRAALSYYKDDTNYAAHMADAQTHT